MDATSHPTTIVAFDADSRQRSLWVEVYPGLEGEAAAPVPVLRAMQRRMFEQGVRVGMVFTPAYTYVVRDLLQSMRFGDNTFEVVQVETPGLWRAARLGPLEAGGGFVRQVRAWLEAVADRWHDVLPPEVFPAMVPEVVGNLAQARFEAWDRALEADNAA